MTIFPDDIEVSATRLIGDFSARGLTLATAESCTGGLIAGALTEVSGSSTVVDRGFVTYSNQAKTDMLGVSPEVLSRFGAVSRETALQMVDGALRRSGANIAVAVTGIAGPSGGTTDKPVGLVHLAAKNQTGLLVHREMRYGDIGRAEIRLATVRTAFELLVAVAG